MEAAKEIDAPGYRAGLPRGSGVYPRQTTCGTWMLAASEAVSRDPDRHAPRESWQQPEKRAPVPSKNGFHLRHDGMARWRKMAKTPASYDYNVKVTADVVEAGPRPQTCRSRGNWAAWVRWKAAWGEKEDGPRGGRDPLARPASHRTPTRPSGSWRPPMWMPWPWPSAPATGPINSPRKPDGEVLAMDRIVEIHRRLPNCQPGDARQFVSSRRNCKTLSTNTAAK